MELTPEKLNQLQYELSVNNSQVALRTLYESFYSSLIRFISYYVRSKQIAEEIMSDTFLSIWEKRCQVIEIQNFKAYIYVVAKNQSVSYLRKEYKKPHNIEQISDKSNLPATGNPEIELINSELINHLNDAIESLPEKCKLVFKLIRDHNLKYKEAAEILEISEKTIEAHMSLAVRRLRENLSNQLYNN